MTEMKRLVSFVAVAFLLALGLAACGEGGPEQQSENPTTEQSSDASTADEENQAFYWSRSSFSYDQSLPLMSSL